MEYNINGSKIKVTRREDTKGISIIEAIIHSYVIDKKRPKEVKNNESKSKEQK